MVGGRGVAAVATVALEMALLIPYVGAETSADNDCYRYKQAERRFARKINRERIAAELPRLRLDPELSKVARVHAREMRAAGETYHQTDAQLQKRITNWIALGENVGTGGSVSGLHQSFLNSPPHAGNVFGQGYRRVGAGVVRSDERIWVTILFEAVDDPGTTLPMPSC